MSADPRIACPRPGSSLSLTYNEAMELAYFGANVLHPQTLGPAVAQRHTGHRSAAATIPSHPGSRIEAAPAEREDGIKGITAIGGMALVNLEGSGMIGVPGTADRLFAVPAERAGVSVTLISQASSEHSICIAVPRDVARARPQDVISEAFADELE